MRRPLWIATATLAATGLLGCTSAAAQSAGSAMGGRGMMRGMAQQESPAFVEVTGNAQVSVPTDRGTIRFAVETQADDAAAATSANADRMDAVIRAVRALGIPSLELETSGYRLEPVYSRPGPGETRRVESYQAVNHVEATLGDVDELGRVLDAGVSAGANRIAGISFSASDTRSARLEAVQRAVAVAREEAEVMAAALGYELGAPLEVRGGAQSPNPISYARNEMVQMAADTPVEPGEQTVTANVTVRFRLGAAR